MVREFVQFECKFVSYEFINLASPRLSLRATSKQMEISHRLQKHEQEEDETCDKLKNHFA